MIVWASSFSPLLGRTRSINRFWAAIRLSHHPEPSGHAPCGGRWIGHWKTTWSAVWSSVPYSQAAEEAIPHLCKQERKCLTLVQRWLSRTHAVLGWVIPGGWDGDESMESRSALQLSAFHRWSAQSAALLLVSSVELTSCCAAGTNRCLDLRYRAFPLDGQVSAEWSRFPGSMAWRVRDSVAPLRRSSARWMPVRVGRMSVGVGSRHPVTVRKALLTAGSMRQVWALRHQTGA